MRIVIVVIVFSIIFVCSGENIKSESESKSENGQSMKAEEDVNSAKTKRGIHALNYPIPTYGHSYAGYARFPGLYRNKIISPYVISPGNAITHSFNVNYPRTYIPRPVIRPAIAPPVLINTKPILPVSPVPLYANRFQVFQPAIVQKPIVHFTIPPHIHHNIHAVNPITLPNVPPQPTLISQNGWRPIFAAMPSNTHINQPSVTILPPLNTPQPALSGTTQTPNNYYLPPKSVRHEIATHAAALGLFDYYGAFV